MNREVEILKSKDIEQYIDFIDEVFEYRADKESIKEMMKEQIILVIKSNDKVVASAVLEKHTEYIKNKRYYHLGYFGVSKDCRRLGYASKLFDRIEELVKENNISYIELTSGNQRRAAHFFYQSRDFKIKDTTVFVKIY